MSDHIVDGGNALEESGTLNYGALHLAAFFLFLLPAGYTLLLDDHLGTVSASVLVQAMLLQGVLLLLPELLSKRLNRLRPSPVFNQLVIVCFLLAGIAGAAFLLPSNLSRVIPALLAVVTIALWGIGGAKIEISGRLVRNTLCWLALLGFFYAVVYGVGHHTLAFAKAMIGRQGNIDTLFHASIAESIHQTGIASTGLDGNIYLHYHWFSHFVLGGLAEVCGTYSLAFYHLFYAPLFITLLLKGFSLVTHQLAVRLNFKAPSPLMYLLFFVAVYAIPFPALRYGHPFPGESFTFSLLIATGLLYTLLRYEKRPEGLDFLLLVTVGITLCLMLGFTKISTGFACIGAVVFVGWYRLSLKQNLLLLPLFGVIAWLVLRFVFPASRKVFELQLAERLRNLFIESGGVYYLLFPLIVLALFAFFYHRRTGHGFREILKTALLPSVYLAAVVIWGLSSLGGLAASALFPDMMLFTFTGIFLTLPLLVIMLPPLIGVSSTKAVWGIGLIVLLLLITNMRVLFFPLKTMEVIKEASIAPDAVPRSELYRDLFAIRGEYASKTTGVYIPQAESWFYESRDSLNIASPCTVPALSGYPMIGGVLQADLEHGNNTYGMIHYKERTTSAPTNLAEAKERAVQLGIRNVIMYERIEGKVRRTLHNVPASGADN